MQKIVFSKHARFQLKERNISEREVKESFKNPDRIIKQRPNRFRLLKVIRKQDKDYLLIIVFERKKSSDEIITAFITSKVKKYL